MVRINTKNIDDFLAKAQETLQNSLIETSYSFTYKIDTLNYVLPGFTLDNERIFSIESIEGIGFLPEDYLTESNLIEGIDYTLYDNYTTEEIVANGYGSASGNQVFTGITIADQTFKDNSTVHLKYKYQNPNYIPILTNFSPNSILRMILTATLLNIQETNEELTQSINAFSLNSSGDDLDRIATLVGLERTVADFTTGQVKIINNDSVNDYSITTSHRFAAISGGTFLAFAPLTSISVPKNGGEVYVNVIAVTSGSYYNIGSNSITFGFTNIELTNRIPTTITVSNPPIGDIGQQNLFNNGTDAETDVDFRKRVVISFSQAKTSSYSTIEQAVINTNLVNYARVYDIDLKKDLAENIVQVFIATKTGNRLSSSSLTQIADAIKQVKPAGSRPFIKQTLNTYINFDINIYVGQHIIGDTATLNAELITIIDEFINSKGIGDDILPSSIVSILKSVSEVLDIEINSHTITEFTSEAAVYDGQVNISTAGVADNWIALEVPFNSATYLHSEIESGITGDSLDLAASNLPYPVDSRTSPRVNIGVTGYDGSIRHSPLDRTDYYLSGNRSTITYDPATLGGDGITTSDLVLFNYNYFDNMLIDGFRIRLGGTAANTVSVDFGYGTTPDSFISIITPVIVTLDGTEKLYDVPLASQLNCDNNPTYSPDSTNFWLILKYDTGTGDSYLPVDLQQTTMAFSPSLHEDAGQDGIYEINTQKRANWHSYTTYTSANAYKKIIIPSQTDEPEKSISYNNTFNFQLFVEE